MQKPDYSKISPELRAKLEEMNKARPENQSLQVLQDIALMLQDILMTDDEKRKGSNKTIEEFGALLTDARESLQTIANKEDKELPDYAKPIVEVLSKVLTAINAKEYSPKIDVKVPDINVPTPQATVNVDAPDLKGIERLLKTEVPKAFEEAISKIPPTVLPEYPDRWDEVLKWLEDIDTGTRMKPLPGSMKVTNPDGTLIGSSASDGSIVDGVDTAIKATVLDLTTSNPLTVGIVDGTGAQITSFGGGTQYTEGDTDASITGTASLMEVAGNTLQPIQGTVADGLLVNLGANNDVTVTGTVTAAAQPGVDIGDVDVLSVIPGTGATNLGKAVDSAVGATDTGVALLAKHVADQVATTVSDGDYELLETDSLGSLHVNAEAHHKFDGFNATTGWSVLGDDTGNLATTTKHVTGTLALTFDKLNGTANTIFAGIQKTLSSVDLGDISQHDLLQGTFYLPSISNVSYVFLRLGTDSTNYNEWRLPDTALEPATFETGALPVGDANYAGITGNGWNPSAITYIAVGVAFDNQTDTLAGIVFDEISYHTNQHTSTILGAEVTTEVSTPNVNLQKIGGTATDRNVGTASNGTLRVTIATDDEINDDLDAIKTAVEVIDNAIAGSEMQVDVVAALPAGTNAIGKLTQPTVATLANVTMTGASVTVQASNANRRNLMIFNDSGVVVYVKLAAAASATSFTIKMADQSYYELPDPVYTGIVTAFGASGDVRVTEVA